MTDDVSTEPLAGDWIRPAMIAAGVALLTAVAFLPVLACGFINGDDDWNFRDNLAFRGLDWEQIQWAWTTRLVGVYQPVAWMILEAEYESFGLAPRGYHATSLVLHSAIAVVLFFLTRALLNRCRPGMAGSVVDGSSAVAALLFAVHPLRAEVVAWASCQPYLPCVLCSMLAVLAYLKAHDASRSPVESRRWLIGSVALAIAGLLCKAPAVALPAILVVLDFYPLRRLGVEAGDWPWSSRSACRVWLEKLGFFVPTLVVMALAVDARRSLSMTQAEARPLIFRIAQASFAACFYPIKTVAPFDLVAFYPFPSRPDWLSARFLASLVVVVGLSVLAWRVRRRWPGFSSTWAAYLIALAPCSGLVPMGRSMLADRYSYLSMLVWVPLVAFGLTKLAGMRRWDSDASGSGRFSGPLPPCAGGSAWGVGVVRPETRATVLGLALFGSLAVTTAWQCSTWRDPETLWRHALTHGSANSADVLTALGTVLAEHGRLSEAEAQFAEAVRIEPTSAVSRNNLGLVRLDRGDPARAIPELLEAIRLRPDYHFAYNNLGLALARTGKPLEAVKCFERALRARPNSAETQNNLGFTLLELGRKAEAVEHFRQALEVRPDYAPARRNLLAALAPTEAR
jgi:Flp pilus assembly protein TadD